MATKRASKRTSKQARGLKNVKKLENTKPLTGNLLAKGCAAGVHYTSITLN